MVIEEAKQLAAKLRAKAALFENSDLSLLGIAKDYKDAAVMIEKLSEEKKDE